MWVYGSLDSVSQYLVNKYNTLNVDPVVVIICQGHCLSFQLLILIWYSMILDDIQRLYMIFQRDSRTAQQNQHWMKLSAVSKYPTGFENKINIFIFVVILKVFGCGPHSLTRVILIWLGYLRWTALWIQKSTLDTTGPLVHWYVYSVTHQPDGIAGDSRSDGGHVCRKRGKERAGLGYERRPVCQQISSRLFQRWRQSYISFIWKLYIYSKIYT